MRADLLLGLSLTLAVATIAPPPARACGPDFPISLLLDRGQTLATLPDGTFLLEVERLTAAPPYVWQSDSPQPDDAGSRERALYEAGDYAAVLALPPAQRRHRSTWAAYMQGRDGSGEAAIRAYRRVRALADDGYEDVAGLAASSLGQEARLHYQRGEWAEAVRLYAAQAATGHPDGGLSLLFVMRTLIADGREREILRDPIGQRLAATYLASRYDELDEDEGDRLWRELSAIDHIAGADQLAAVAYQRGEWDRAAALAAGADDSPVRAWVQAKLALRDGDHAAADRLLAQAAEGFRLRAGCTDEAEPARDLAAPRREDLAMPDTTEDDWFEPELICGGIERDRILGERVALALGAGRMTEALALAWQVRDRHPDDLAYVAERVVTLDELIAFVEALPAAAPIDHHDWEASPASLRALLGRRLMRAGRYALAIRYLGPSARLPAIQFGLAMATAGHVHDPIDRARALFKASAIARKDGLEILGTAGAPDWELYGAQYDRFAWEDRTWSDRVHGAGEVARVLASAPAYAERYHYRYLAADLAEQAADLLPHHTQAFAVALCRAGRYVGSVDPDRARRLYQRYVEQASADADVSFGYDCPDPDFKRARLPPPRRPPPEQALLGDGHHARRDAIALLALLAVALLIPLGLALPRRRWRRFTPRP